MSPKAARSAPPKRGPFIAAFALGFAVILTLLLPSPATAATAFAAGSYIIPMDTTHQDQGMFKAYGLVYRLLQQGVPVSWAIRPGKGYPPPGPTTGPFSGANPIDVTATTNDLRLGTVIGAFNYSGGPFIIAQANVAAAMPIITAWWAANANQPNVHVATAVFSADINIILNRAPRIALEQTNSAIAINYFKAAGIPDDSGAVWSTSSPNIFSQARIANGELLGQDAGCGKLRWDVFVTPHNGGYSYSLSDPANLGTRTYAELDKFVFFGGGWIALCHSIESNEDNIAALYNSPFPAVRSLFLSSQNSGFLTQNGFGSNIVNKGGTYVLNQADLPIGQAVTTPGATQSLPGGSVQTWQTVPGGTPSGVQYLAGVERVAWFDDTALGKQYDHVVNGVYHGGDGRGKLSFIGGHSFATSLPYSTNFEAPYVRFFLNALYFNGAAVARLVLDSPTTSVSAGVTSNFQVRLTNGGASTAAGISNTSINLAAGVTYLGMASGPFPDCDPTGASPGNCSSGVLTWNRAPGLIPDLAGGASGLVINVVATYPTAVSPPISPPNVGTMLTKYGDNFNESFTGGDCFSMTVTPAPVPAVMKTRIENPADPGSGIPDQYVAGNVVYWTLAYANTGAASLLNGVVEDILPAGFTLHAATTSPAPSSVVPQAGGTTRVRWNLGTLAAGAGGSITLGAVAPVIATSSQTFTNVVTLTGFDAAGVQFTSAPASATATVVSPSIDLGKVVDKTSANPGEVLTYNITPAYAGNVRLTNATVTDPIPSNSTYVASSANADGFLDTSVTPNQVTWNLGSNRAPITGTRPNTGFAVCPATATFDTTTGIIDTYIDKDDPTANFGTLNRLLTRPANATRLKYTLVRFNLGTAIPAGSIIQSAFFRLTVQTARNQNHFDSVRRMVTPWTDAGATWNTRNGATAWAGGGAFSSADYGTTNFGNMVPRANNVQYSVDIAGMVDNWVNNGVPNNGLALVSTGTDGGDARYYSNEEATASRRPVLVVTYLIQVGPLTPPAVGCSGSPTTLTAIGDTFVNKDKPTENKGADNTLSTNPGINDTTTKTIHGLIQFDLSQVPPGATITSAFLKVNVTSSRSNHVDEIRRLTTAWNEPTATFSRQNATNSWAAGNFSPADYAATVYNTITPSVNGTSTPCGPQAQYCRDVTALVDDWVNNGFVNNGLALISTGTDEGEAKYSTREEGTAANRPQLIVNWSAPPNLGTPTTTRLSVSPLLQAGPGNVTVTMTVDAGADIGEVTPPTNLSVNPGTNTVVKISGPSPATAPADGVTPATFTWVYSVTPGATADDELFFSGKPVSSTLGASFGTASSPSIITTPVLTFRVTIANPLVPATTQQITNVARFSDDTAIGSQDSQTAVTTILRPQLSLTKANSPTGTVNPGDTLTYTLVLRNDGVGIAFSAMITDAVPANSTFLACLAPGCSSSPAVGGTGNVVWNLGDVAANTVVTRSFQVRASTTVVASATPYTISNTATAASTSVASFSSNTVTNSLDATPRLTITKSNNVTGTPVSPGDAIQYTLVIRNTGLLSVSGTVMTDVLPAGTTFVSCVAPGCTTAPAVGATSGTMTWDAANIGVIAAGATVTRSFNVTVTFGQVDGSSIVNGASLTATGLSSPVQSNLVSNTVSAPARLAISKTASPAPGDVAPGTVITYTLTITNNGPGYTDDASVTDTIPAGTTYIANSTRFIAADSSACPIDEVTPGVPPIEGSLPVFSPPAVCPAPGDPAGTDSGTLYTNPPVALPVAATITFQVRVNNPIAMGTTITNTAIAAVGSPSAPCTASPAVSPTVPPYCITSNSVVHQIPMPTVALSVVKTAASPYPIYDPATWPTCSLRANTPDPGFTSVNCAYFTVTVTNGGPHAASNFSISEVLPANLSNPQFVASQGNVTGPSAGAYTWQVSGPYNSPAGPPGLPAGASATLQVAAMLCDAFGLGGPADSSCISTTGSDNGQTNNVTLSNPEQIDTNSGTPALRASSATVYVLALTPATLRGLRVDPAGGRIQFAVGSQTDTRGFHVWVSDKKKAAMRRLTPELIEAPVPSSMAPVIYNTLTAPFKAKYLFVEEIDLRGRTHMMGPFEVGDKRLETAFDMVQRKLDGLGKVSKREGKNGGSALTAKLAPNGKKAKKPKKGKTSADGPRDAAKILTVGSGMVTVPRAQLEALGLPHKTKLENVKVTAFGQSIPAMVSDVGKPGEALHFVATGIDTTYSGRAAYIASWNKKAAEPLVNLSFPEAQPPSGFVRAQGHGVYVSSAPREINPWVWDWLWGDGSTWPYQDFSDPADSRFDLPGLLAGGSGTVPVHVSFWVLGDGDHELSASVNGASVGTINPRGRGLAVLKGEVPRSALRALGNALSVRYIASAGGQAFAYLRHIEVGATVDLARSLAAVDEITPYNPELPAIKDTNYLIVTHGSFMNAANRLAQLKSAEGYKTAVVDAERIYDAYSGGVFDAAAIRLYLADAYRNKRLAFVALIGDDTVDPQDYYDSGAESFIPSLFGWDGEFGRVAAENLYADLDGDGAPDLAIGRLPASTPEEADALVDKIARQASVLRTNRGKNLFVTDNEAPGDPNFDTIAGSVAAKFRPTAWARIDDGIDQARANLAAGWNRGVSLVHYFGHGGPELWADEAVLTVEDAAALTSPEAVVLQRACLSQNYQYFWGPSVGEALMLNPKGGALASFGPSGITHIRFQKLLFDRLYDEMLAAPGLPLGEAIRRAKAKVLKDDPAAAAAVEGFNLLGDPALRMDGVAAAVKIR